MWSWHHGCLLLTKTLSYAVTFYACVFNLSPNSNRKKRWRKGGRTMGRTNKGRENNIYWLFLCIRQNVLHDYSHFMTIYFQLLSLQECIWITTDFNSYLEHSCFKLASFGQFTTFFIISILHSLQYINPHLFLEQGVKHFKGRLCSCTLFMSMLHRWCLLITFDINVILSKK